MNLHLEPMAKDLFDSYTRKNNSRSANWSLLANDRKVVWMEEVIMAFEAVCDEIRSQIKPVPMNKAGTASYERGYNEGLRRERIQLITDLSNIELQLQQQLEAFKSGDKKAT